MKIYIANYLSNSISVIDRDALKFEKKIFVGDNVYPHHFCVDKEKQYIYIPNLTDGNIYILDMNDDSIVDIVSIGGSPNQILLDDNDIFISNGDSDSINVIDRNTFSAKHMINVGEFPHGFDFSKKDKILYVPCRDYIYAIDMLSKKVTDYKFIGYDLWHLIIDEKKQEIYISTLDGYVVVIDKDTLETRNILNCFFVPVEVRINYKYSKIYVTDLGLECIKILDYDSKNVLGTIKVNGIPQGLEIAKDEEVLMITDSKLSQLRVFECKHNKEIKNIDVEREPTSIMCL